MIKIFLLILFIAVAFGRVSLISGKGRSIVHESVALELEFEGSCAQFQTNYNSIQVSQFTSPNCLPINLDSDAPFDDNNDLNAHILCVNINHGRRSLVRFVEIFPGTNDTDTLPPGTVFLVSLVTTIPFRVRYGNYQYIARPGCSIAADYCTPSTLIISQCTNYNVGLNKRGFIQLFNQRIYLVPPSTTVNGCSNSTGSCCPYISTTSPSLCTNETFNNIQLNSFNIGNNANDANEVNDDSSSTNIFTTTVITSETVESGLNGNNDPGLNGDNDPGFGDNDPGFGDNDPGFHGSHGSHGSGNSGSHGSHGSHGSNGKISNQNLKKKHA